MEFSSLYEFYIHADTELSSFKVLFNITIRLINKVILISYDAEGLLSSQKAHEYLEIEENWSETDLDYQVVLTEKGLNYLNKVFYEKIDSKSFPEFNRIIENEVLF